MARYAAIDIGSNSIRMEAAEVVAGSPPRILASDREVTRLGQSVFQSGRISQESMELTCSVLTRMAAAYSTLDLAGVRAVGTASVRDARNQAEFLERASRALGTPVEVISGREEARLIEMGVQSRWPHPRQRVLIIDIGGGSVEIIASEEGRMRDAVSKPLGAVRLREIFLGSDPPSPPELHRMRDYMQERLAGVPHRFGPMHWDRFIATSGTAAAVLCAIAGVPRPKRDRADRVRATTAQVRRLAARLSGMGLQERRRVTGIGPRRAEIIVPGITLLLAILEQFQAHSVSYCAAGVRDGIIADLAARGIGRERSELSREQRKEERGFACVSAFLSNMAARYARWPGRCSTNFTRCTSSRPHTASCFRRPPTCTTSGTTSTIKATTNTLTTWLQTRMCPASPAASGSSLRTCAAITARRCRPWITAITACSIPRSGAHCNC